MCGAGRGIKKKKKKRDLTALLVSFPERSLEIPRRGAGRMGFGEKKKQALLNRESKKRREEKTGKGGADKSREDEKHEGAYRVYPGTQLGAWRKGVGQASKDGSAGNGRNGSPAAVGLRKS